MDSINNICRLCSTTQNLQWVFDRKFHCIEKLGLVDAISLITGIEILAEDYISQKICSECYQILLTVIQFRKRARKNNNILMKRYKGMLETLPIVRESLDTGKAIKTENKMKTSMIGKPNHQNLSKQYPGLNLPSTWLSYNIQPCIILEKNTVDNFLRKEAEPNQRLNNGDSIHKSSIFDKNTVNTKKRRLTDSDYSSDSSSSEPLPKRRIVDEFSEGLCLERSVPLFICSICESVYDSAMQLKKHHFKHLRCQFCRSRFNSVNSKEAHIRSMCAIKDIVTQQPSVELDKIELDLEMRKKYPEAFIGCPLISELQWKPSSTEDEASGHNISRNGGCEDNDDVIEIFEDDSSFVAGSDVSRNTLLRDNVVGPVRINKKSEIASFCHPTKSTVTSGVSSIVPSVMPNSSSDIPTTASIISVTIASIDRSSAHLQPGITIENSNVLDDIDPGQSDIDAIIKLLTNTAAIKKEVSSQTELSCVNQSGDTIKLELLRNSLFLYDIPFVFKKGDFQARYDYNSTNFQTKQTKKLRLWNDLTPSDVTVARSSIDGSSIQDRIPALTPELATKSLSIPTSTSNSTGPTIHPFTPSSDPNVQACGRNSRSSITVNSSSVSSNVTSLPFIYKNSAISGTYKEPFPNITLKTSNSGFPLTKSTAMEKVSSIIDSPPIFSITPVISANPPITAISPSVLSSAPPIVPPTRSVISTSYNSSTYLKPQLPAKHFIRNDMNTINMEVVDKSRYNEGSVRNGILATKNLCEIASNCTKTTIPSNPPLFTSVPIQKTSHSIDRLSTPLNFPPRLSSADVSHQLVSSKFVIVNKDPCSNSPKYVRIRLWRNTAKQLSNTGAANSVPNGLPNCVVTKEATSHYPEATMGGLQPHIPCRYGMRNPAIIHPVSNSNLAVLTMRPVVDHSSMNSAPNARYTHSTIYNLQNSLTVQNKVPNVVPNTAPFTTASGFTGPVSTRIRVKSLQELM